jgi:hypothetical protein
VRACCKLSSMNADAAARHGNVHRNPPTAPRPPPPPPRPSPPLPRHIPPPPPGPLENVPPVYLPPQRQQPPASPRQQPEEPQQQQHQPASHQHQQQQQPAPEAAIEPRRQEEQQQQYQWQQQQQQQEQQQEQPTDWTLHLAVDIPASATHPAEQQNSHHRRSSNNNNNNYMILRIHVTADMDATMLSRCIQQACVGVWALQERGGRLGVPDVGGNSNGTSIVGLFAQESRIFVSLHHLLQQAAVNTHSNNNNSSNRNNRHWQKQVYWLRLPPIPVAPSKAVPWYQIHAPIIAGVLAIGVMAAVIQDHHGLAIQASLASSTMYLQNAVLDSARRLHYTLVDFPLQDLYRHGPWFVGWEGDDLSRICARITFHGDASFWSVNTDECLRIYQGKLQAFLRLARPVLITVLGLVLVFVLRLLWWEVQRHVVLRKRQQYRAPPAGPPADMVETYQAFQTLLRQVQRTLAPQPQQQHAIANDQRQRR